MTEARLPYYLKAAFGKLIVAQIYLNFGCLFRALDGVLRRTLRKTKQTKGHQGKKKPNLTCFPFDNDFHVL
tara:strand:- start:392 stop:604 length:213 start_codon:yes stop_codon:yes gene_type:complete